jgi:hypothetical protein
MQAGLASRRLTFRDIFCSTKCLLALSSVTFVSFDLAIVPGTDDTQFPVEAWQHRTAEAPSGVGSEGNAEPRRAALARSEFVTALSEPQYVDEERDGSPGK